RPVGLQVKGRARDKTPTQVGEYQRADVELFEACEGNLFSDECLVVVLREAPGVGPVSPATCGKLELCERPIQGELNAPHRDVGLGMLECGKARHQHIAGDKDCRYAQGGEQRGDQRRDLRTEEHTSELQSPYDLVCRLLLEKKKK